MPDSPTDPWGDPQSDPWADPQSDHWSELQSGTAADLQSGTGADSQSGPAAEAMAPQTGHETASDGEGQEFEEAPSAPVELEHEAPETAAPETVDATRADTLPPSPVADAAAIGPETAAPAGVDEKAWWAPSQPAPAQPAPAQPAPAQPGPAQPASAQAAADPALTQETADPAAAGPAAPQHAQPMGYAGSPMTAAVSAGYAASPYGPVPTGQFPVHPATAAFPVAGEAFPVPGAAYPATATGAIPAQPGAMPVHPGGFGVPGAMPTMTGAIPAQQTGQLPTAIGAIPVQPTAQLPTATGAIPAQSAGPAPSAPAPHELVAQPWPAVPGTAHGSGAPRSRAGLVAAIAGLCALLLVLLAGLTAAGIYVAASLQSMEGTIEQAPAPGTPGGDEPQTVPGTVLDSSGAPVDGLGTPDAPAIMGENSLRWPTEDGGTLTLEIESVTWNADEDIKASDPSAPAPEAGMHYALITIRGTYEGEKYAVLGDDIDLAIETDAGVYYDDGQIRAPEPLWRMGGITDGESASGQMVIAVPEAEVGSALVSVAPWGGDYLYVAES